MAPEGDHQTDHGDVPGATVEPTADTPARATRARGGKQRKPFERTKPATPSDAVARSHPRALDDEMRAERDRIDAPSDSLGRKRPQMSMDAFAELMIRAGLRWAKTLPDWSDPLALPSEDDDR